MTTAEKHRGFGSPGACQLALPSRPRSPSPPPAPAAASSDLAARLPASSDHAAHELAHHATPPAPPAHQLAPASPLARRSPTPLPLAHLGVRIPSPTAATDAPTSRGWSRPSGTASPAPDEVVRCYHDRKHCHDHGHGHHDEGHAAQPPPSNSLPKPITYLPWGRRKRATLTGAGTVRYSTTGALSRLQLASPREPPPVGRPS